MSEQTFNMMDLVLSQQIADGMLFVLLTVKGVEGEGDEESVTVGIQSGNGIDTADDIKSFLALALIDIPGFTLQDARDMVEELEARERHGEGNS